MNHSIPTEETQFSQSTKVWQDAQDRFWQTLKKAQPQQPAVKPPEVKQEVKPPVGPPAQLTIEKPPVPAPVPKPILNEDVFAELDHLCLKYFEQPDLQAIHIALGVLMTHYLAGDEPIWLFFVGPPGAGKTTISLFGASGLGQTELISEVTPKTFLSGWGAPRSGLLEKLGKPNKEEKGKIVTEGNGIFLIKDFTSLLSARKDDRATIMAQLREIHDGEFRRDFGTGQTKIWKGKVTILAAVTPAVDIYTSVLSILGERFMKVQIKVPTNTKAGKRAIRQRGEEAKIRSEIQAAIDKLFLRAVKTLPDISDEQADRIACLAQVTAMARTHVLRGYNGEIVDVPEHEVNTRLSQGIAGIAQGMAALRRHPVVTEADLQDAMRAGIESMPRPRYLVLSSAMRGKAVSTRKLQTKTRNNAILDLIALHVLQEVKHNDEPLSPGTPDYIPVFEEDVLVWLKLANVKIAAK